METVESSRLETYPGGPVPFGWKRLVQVKLENPGLNAKEAAKVLGLNYTTVYSWQRKPEYQAYEDWVLQARAPVPREQLVKVREEVIQRVRLTYETHMEEMQERLLAILDTCDDARLQASIAQDWLDRSGAGAPKLAEQRATPVLLTPEALAEFAKRASEAGIIVEGEVISTGTVAQRPQDSLAPAVPANGNS